jgi:hypothetical protein
MSNQIQISKIEIKIGKQVISLTPDELKELKAVLDATFPEKEVVKWIPQNPIIIDRPVYPPNYGDITWPYKRWDIVWCSDTTNALNQTMSLTLKPENK